MDANVTATRNKIMDSSAERPERGGALAGIALCALALATVAALPAHAQVGERAGVAGAVRGKVSLASFRAARNAVGRAVASGDAVRLGDRITTGPESGLQIMLLDRTTFTIGPDAAMVIDKFVYDPSRKTGSMSARVLKGTFRFVSGAIARARPEAVTIRMPAATIGIRGTIVLGRTNGQDSLAVLAGPGERNNAGLRPSQIVVLAGGRTITIVKPSFGVFVRRAGGPPSAPRLYNVRALSGVLNSIGAPRAGPGEAPGVNRAPTTRAGLTPGTTLTRAARLAILGGAVAGPPPVRTLDLANRQRIVGALFRTISPKFVKRPRGRGLFRRFRRKFRKK